MFTTLGPVSFGHTLAACRAHSSIIPPMASGSPCWRLREDLHDSRRGRRSPIAWVGGLSTRRRILVTRWEIDCLWWSIRGRRRLRSEDSRHLYAAVANCHGVEG